jgi:hypothetical protein
MAAVPSNGTLLAVEISSVFTTITQRTEINLPGTTRTPIETTDLDSTWSTWIVGIKRSEELEFTLNWDPAATTHAYLQTAITNGSAEDFKITLTDAGAATIEFTAYVSADMPEAVGIDGLVKKKFKLRPTGAITLTP